MKTLPLLLLATAAFGSMPGLHQPLVIENVGQFPPEVRYQALQGGDAMWITNDAIWLSKRGAAAIRVDFEGAQAFDIRMTGHSPTKVSYFVGNDPDQWHPDVPVYAGVALRGLYENVDLEIDGASGQFEWRWIVKRGGKPPARDAMRISGAEGETPFRMPGVYDEAGNAIGGKGGRREAGAADLVWATFTSFSGENPSRSAIDAAGNVYLCGMTDPVNSFFATPNAFQSTSRPGFNGYVLKLNGSGSSLAFATFIGGDGGDNASDIFVEAAGSILVTGSTSSTDFPTLVGALQRNRGGFLSDAFVLRLNAAGSSLLASTLFGGEHVDLGLRIVGLPGSKVGIAGITTSESIFGANTTCFRGGNEIKNGYIAELNSGLTGVVHVKTFCASEGSLQINAIGANSAGDLFLGGRYNAVPNQGSNFPIFVPSLTPLAGVLDVSGTGGFVLKLSAGGALNGWRFGGNSNDSVTALAVDPAGHVVAAGSTSSGNFPVTAGVIRQSREDSDGFVTVFRPDTGVILYSTLFGGPSVDGISSIALDAGGGVYALGFTSGSIPATPNAYSTVSAGAQDLFVALIKDEGRTLAYATYYGGTADDLGVSIGVLPDQTVLVTGFSKSTTLPGTSAASFQQTPPPDGQNHPFVAKFIIYNPGAVSGYAFQDFNQDGVPGPYELPLTGLFVYYDANVNGIFESARERYAVAQNLVLFNLRTNIPYIPSPNYGLNNLAVGKYRICATFAPNLPNASTCKTVFVLPGGTTQNVNFGLLPGQVGVSSLTPANSNVKTGDPVAFDLNWITPGPGWRSMNDWILRFTAADGTEAIQIRYVEATNKFSVYNSNAGKFGPEFSPGENPSLETNLAKFHVEQSAAPVAPGTNVHWRLVISFKPQAAGKTYVPQFLITTDSGLAQGYEPLGAVTVTK